MDEGMRAEEGPHRFGGIKMFGLGNLVKAVTDTVMLPVDAVIDTVTLGGELTDTDPRTLRRLQKLLAETDPDADGE
jgi:hypothetical protein